MLAELWHEKAKQLAAWLVDFILLAIADMARVHALRVGYDAGRPEIRAATICSEGGELLHHAGWHPRQDERDAQRKPEAAR